MSIRVGVVGIGAMGRHHVRVLSELAEVDLVGLSDIDPKVEDIARHYGVDFFREREQLLLKKPDLVVVAVPTPVHYEVGMDVLNAGCHLFMEKPITDSVESARRLIAEAKRRGLMLFVGHIERFNPVVRRLKELIEAGRFGEVHSIANLRVGRYRQGTWETAIILDLGTHDIDIISFLYGKPATTVFAVGHRQSSGVEEQASLSLKFSSKESGYIELSWLTPYKVRKMFITGTRHFGLVDLVEQSIIIYDGDKWARTESVEPVEPLVLELKDVLRCIKEGNSPEVTAEDSLYALMVAQSAITSIREGKAVELTGFTEGELYPIRHG